MKEETVRLEGSREKTARELRRSEVGYLLVREPLRHYLFLGLFIYSVDRRRTTTVQRPVSVLR